MYTASNLNTYMRAPLVVPIPSEGGVFPIKSLVFATALAVCSSSSAQGATISPVRLDGGSGGVSIVARQQEADVSIADHIAEIRRLSGLTWTQLASILKVSRTTLNSWANGAAVRASNADAVYSLVERIKSAGELPIYKIRAMLLNAPSTPPRGAPVPGDENPILMSDNRPFTHQLERRPSTTRIRRG